MVSVDHGKTMVSWGRGSWLERIAERAGGLGLEKSWVQANNYLKAVYNKEHESLF